MHISKDFVYSDLNWLFNVKVLILVQNILFIYGYLQFAYHQYLIVAVGSSGILKGKQKLGVTLNSDKLDGIDFTKFSKLTMCSAVPRRKPSLVQKLELFSENE